MIRLFLIAVLFLICSCAANEPLPKYQTKYEKVNVSGVDVVPASQMSQLWIGMPEDDVYKVLGHPSSKLGPTMLFFDLYESQFSGRTVPHYVLLNMNGLVKQWGSSGSPDKAVDMSELDY